METRTELSLRLSALADEVAEIAQSLEEDHGMDDAAAALDYAIEKIREARMLARPGVCRMDADTLKEQFAKAAEKFGYDDARAEVEELPQLKVRWVRTSGGWIRLTVSDYLLALTPEAAYDLAAGVLGRLAGAGPSAPSYGRASEEMSSEAFAMANQDRFAERNGLARSPAAWSEYQRLAAEQGVELPAGMRVFAEPEDGGMTGTYPTMRVAVLPCDMDQSGPEALAWIERAAVEIGRGHCGLFEDAPDAYVDLSGVE